MLNPGAGKLEQVLVRYGSGITRNDTVECALRAGLLQKGGPLFSVQGRYLLAGECCQGNSFQDYGDVVYGCDVAQQQETRLAMRVSPLRQADCQDCKQQSERNDAKRNPHARCRRP
jgi:hypothetical protein